ncbi:MAG: cytochrome b/b6 domain-containing protein [Phycisphaeraceae bacterium]|nr:cytochrome b/b6 domain-containing protein [Phycisphaeraceae bacterium]
MFETVFLILIATALVGMLVHLLFFGPKRTLAETDEDRGRTVRRLSRLERLIHAMLATSFLVLAGTGMGAMWLAGELGGWMLYAHVLAGAIFAAALTGAMIRWAAQNVFIPLDLLWVRHGWGGFFRRADRHAPAGRFDAGQKVLFWLTATLGLATMLTILLTMQPWFGYRGQAILIDLHRYAGLLLVVVVLIHLYATLLAKPGAWKSMFRGRVSAAWARSHHESWHNEATQKGD